MAEFEIKVQELESGGKQYDFSVRRAWLDEALSDLPAGHSPIRGDASVPDGTLSIFAEKSGEDVVVRGRLRTQVVTECARCLGDATIPVDAELVTLYTARGADFRPVADEDELSPEEIDREFYAGDEVVLDPLVREHVLLEIPMQPLCREACTGLEVPASIRGPADLEAAATSAAPTLDGRPVDPRLAPLMALLPGGAPSNEPATPPTAGSTAKKKPKGAR